jgi:putative glutamine amidotransferase
MSRPVVGITCYVEPARWGAWDTRAAVLPMTYVDNVRRAGGRPVIIPPDDLDADVLDRLDGLVIAGGADVNPALYGAEPEPGTDAPRLDRDAGEVLLFQAARERDLPVLGICRGMQIMAVASGGTLVQDIPSATGSQIHRPGPGQFSDHQASFVAGSKVAGIVGESTVVNSSHHQSVVDSGSLTVTGWAQDDSIEALEDPTKKFVVGLQWHPEARDEERVFKAFVDACKH